MIPTEKLDWDNLRVFLAVMRSASMRKAADKLGVSHPTIARKVEALESDLGLKLFDRRSDGLHATPEGAEVMEMAEAVEASVHALGRRARDADPELKGTVRITAPNLVMTDLLFPELVNFSQRWPQIELDVELSYQIANLAAREADVAIRTVPHGQTPSGDLAGRKAGTSYASTYGTGDHWIGWSSPDEDREWIEKTEFPECPVRGRFSSPYLQREACAAGMGMTRLPCFFAEPKLPRRTEPQPHSDLWVLVHPDLRRSPRLRLFRDEMVAAIRRLGPRLRGEVAAS